MTGFDAPPILNIHIRFFFLSAKLYWLITMMVFIWSIFSIAAYWPEAVLGIRIRKHLARSGYEYGSGKNHSGSGNGQLRIRNKFEVKLLLQKCSIQIYKFVFVKKIFLKSLYLVIICHLVKFMLRILEKIPVGSEKNHSGSLTLVLSRDFVSYRTLKRLLFSVLLVDTSSKPINFYLWSILLHLWLDMVDTNKPLALCIIAN